MPTLPIVNNLDKRKGIVTAIITMLLLFLYLMFATLEMADPPPQDILVEATTEFPKEIVLKDLKIEGGSGSGKSSNNPVEKLDKQTEQVITKKTNKNTKVNTGKANKTNAPESKNSSTTTHKSTDPFSSGGNGTGNNGGSSNTFGSDSGTGISTNKGIGSGDGRIRINDPVMEELRSNVNVTIHLILTIDSEGNIISGSSIKGKTTTTNQILINKVINEVKKQVKYNKQPGAPLAKVYMSVKIKAQ